jgi:hypothetical protein
MRGIARLLLGDGEPGRDGDRDGDDRFAPGDGDIFGLGEQARRAGDWCGSTPRGGSIADALLGGGRTAPGKRPGRR